jgi:hypothetical protein
MLHFGLGELSKVKLGEKEFALDKNTKMRITIKIKNNEPYRSIFQYICADWGRFIEYERSFDPLIAKS